MIKVLIVDDEKNVRDDLATLINWEEYNFKIVGFASNGKQAFNIFNDTNPDLVITDIVMPVMDGIELSRKIHEINKSVVIVLLTAYKDSDCAIQAVNIGVNRYLLKYSLNADNLLRELSDIKNEINTIRINETIVNQKLLSELLDAQQDEEIIYSYLQQLKVQITKSSYCIVALSIDKYINLDNSLFLDDYVDIKKEVFKEIDNIFVENINYICVEKSFNLLYILCYFINANSESQIKQKIHTVCTDLQKSIISSKRETISIGISDIFYSPTSIQKFYIQCTNRLRYCFFEGSNSIIQEDRKVNHLYKSNRENLHSGIQEIFDFILKGKSIDIIEHLKPIFFSFDNKQEVKLFSIEIINFIKKFLDDNGIDQRLIFGEFVLPSSKMDNFRNIYEYIKWFDNLFVVIRDHILYRNNKNFSRKTMKALNYITMNYSKPINLDKIAKELDISKVYFCNFFKKETGFSFISYLNNYRIDKAKKMLRNTDLKIYEIADLVGFINFQYFSLIFKKATGLSPVEYRNCNLFEDRIK